MFPFQSWNPPNKGFDGFTKLAGKKLGIGMDMGTNGHLGMNAKVSDLKGTVDVFYGGNTAITHPDVNTFLAGDTTPISSSWVLNPSATTVSAGTTGDLQLDMDMKIHTFLTTEACLLFGCSDLFSIPTINFETHPTLFKFDDNLVNQVPELLTDLILGASFGFSGVDVNPSTTLVNTANGQVIAKDTNTFSTMSLDLDEIFSRIVNGIGPSDILCPPIPAPPPCLALGGDFNIDETTLAYDYFDAASDIDFIAEQELRFDTDVLLKLEFDRPVSGVLGPLVDVTTDSSGQVTSVVYNTGDEISITFPIDDIEPIIVTPTLLLDPQNTKLHNFAKIITDSDVTMTAGFADYSIQSFEVTPAFTFTYPHILGHWHCHDRVFGVCVNWHSHEHTHSKRIGAITFPGVTLPTLGPLWDSGPQGNVMRVNVLSNDDFALGGFNTVELDSFLLDPEIPPTADIGGPYVIDEGSTIPLNASKSFDVDITAEPLTYSWDLDNDGQFDDATGITVEFSNTADGPATHPVSLQVCDPFNCDIDSGMVEVLNVDPTVEAGNADSADEGALFDYTATFTDPGFDCDTCGTLEDFTAIVNWGEFDDESLKVTETPGSAGVLTQGTAIGDNVYMLPLVILIPGGDPSLPDTDVAGHVYRLPGDYTVTVTVDDDNAGTNSDTFVTTVLGAQDLKNRVISTLSPFDNHDVEDVIEKINKSLEPKLWVDAVNLDPKKGHKVFDEEKNAVEKLQK